MSDYIGKHRYERSVYAEADDSQCRICGLPQVDAVHGAKSVYAEPVPAPPTRTEEPEKLTPDEMAKLPNIAFNRLAFLEAEREKLHSAILGHIQGADEASREATRQQREIHRLREQTETMRTWLKAQRAEAPSPHHGGVGATLETVDRKFNELLPPERP